MREINIESQNRVLSATIFGSSEAKVVLVIASATGVRQSFYKKFAEFISSQRIIVITFDYYGIGSSLKKPIKDITTNVADWGVKDLDSVINYSINNFPDCKRTILGHSIGGQLIGLSKLSSKMDKVILVAAQSGYWKYWNGVGRIKMWANWHILFPVLIKLFGYLPSKRISGMENLPKNVAKQWKDWSKKSNYLLSEIALEETVFDKLKTEITAFSIENDQFAPKKAVEWMTERFSQARIKSVHLIPIDYNTSKIGHFGIFKDKFRNNIWQMLLMEIK